MSSPLPSAKQMPTRRRSRKSPGGPNFTESGLMTFLLDPHAKMPNMNLSRIEAGDIAAYVAKLK